MSGLVVDASVVARCFDDEDEPRADQVLDASQETERSAGDSAKHSRRMSVVHDPKLYRESNIAERAMGCGRIATRCTKPIPATRDGPCLPPFVIG